ncbi:MAG: right-handed parallel beta-helix repeat-containing protein [Candidatus Asgardarchaeia archaeon]
MRWRVVLLVLVLFAVVTFPMIDLFSHSSSMVTVKSETQKSYSPRLIGANTITGDLPPSSGDWVITSLTTVENETLIINGSILIQSGGTLLLINSTIQMNLSSDGEYWIEVYNGGNLTAYSSIITAYNPTANYYIKVNPGASFYLDSCEISYAGYFSGFEVDKYGIYINTNGAVIINSYIHDNFYAMYLEGSNNSRIAGNKLLTSKFFLRNSHNNTITKNVLSSDSSTGFYLDRSSGNIISLNNITGVEISFYLWHSPNNTIRANNITNVEFGIQVKYSNSCTISENIISIKKGTLTSDYYSIFLVSSNNSIVENNSFFNGGLHVESSYNNTIRNNTVNNAPLVYYENSANQIINDASQVVLVRCSNVTIDGVNTSNINIGIELWETNNSIISNSMIHNNSYYGIYVVSSSNIIIFNNTMFHNVFHSIYLLDSNNVTISKNSVGGNQAGDTTIVGSSNVNISDNTFFSTVYIGESHDGVIKRNILYNGKILVTRSNEIELSDNIIRLTDNFFGVRLFESNNISVTNNKLTNGGLYVEDSYNNTIKNNTVNGLPIVYFERESNIHISDAGQVILINCVNAVVSNLRVHDVYVGVELWNTNNSIVTESTISNNYYGLLMRESNNISLSNTVIFNSSYMGAYLYQSSFVNVSYNNITLSEHYAIYLFQSANNTLLNNTLSNNYMGIYLYQSPNNTIIRNIISNSDGAGIFLSSSSGNMISLNTLHENKDAGISLSFSSNNTISINTLYKNRYGIYISGHDNFVYLNNFLNNTYQVYVYDTSNIFDNGTFGNYWSDYIGSDIDENLIGDSAYNIASNIYDNYPLLAEVRTYNETIHYIMYVYENNSLTFVKIRVIERNPLYVIVWYTKNGMENMVFANFNPTTNVTVAVIKGVDLAIARIKIILGDNPPVINNVYWTPVNPTSDQSVTIFANVTDDIGISEVILSYEYNENQYNLTMNLVNSTYVAKIPSFDSNTTVVFKVYVRDFYNQSILSDEFNITFDDPPVIESISWTPEIPTSNESVMVFANLVDDIGISKAILSYYDTTWHNVTMQKGNAAYTASIPSYNGGTTILFKVYVIDIRNHCVISDEYSIVFDDPPVILSVDWVPQNPVSGQSVTVITSVEDDWGILNVILSFYNGSWYNITMVKYENSYAGYIPPHSSGVTVTFKVIVIDIRGHVSQSEEYQVTFLEQEKLLFENPMFLSVTAFVAGFAVGTITMYAIKVIRMKMKKKK